MIEKGKIKLIASDMDMTLMNNKREISDYTANVLKKLEQKGIIILIATGRMYQDIKEDMENIGIKPYYILINGAEARDEKGNLLGSIDLLDDDVRGVLSYLKKRNMIPEIYTGDGEYLLCDEKESLKELVKRSNIMKPLHKIDENIAKTTKRYLNRKYLKNEEELLKKNIGIRKIIYFDDNDKVINEIKKDLNSMKNIVTLSSSIYNIEITNVMAQKGYILKKVIEKLGIKEEEVVIFGDGENDKSMFEYFENSVAVSNAIPMIKNMATYETYHHNEDGVAKFIEEEIL